MSTREACSAGVLGRRRQIWAFPLQSPLEGTPRGSLPAAPKLSDRAFQYGRPILWAIVSTPDLSLTGLSTPNGKVPDIGTNPVTSCTANHNVETKEQVKLVTHHSSSSTAPGGSLMVALMKSMGAPSMGTCGSQCGIKPHSLELQTRRALYKVLHRQAAAVRDEHRTRCWAQRCLASYAQRCLASYAERCLGSYAQRCLGSYAQRCLGSLHKPGSCGNGCAPCFPESWMRWSSGKHLNTLDVPASAASLLPQAAATIAGANAHALDMPLSRCPAAR